MIGQYDQKYFAPSSWDAETRALCSFNDFFGSKPALTDQTANIQDGLFEAQRLYYEYRKTTGYDDQFLTGRFIDFIVPQRFYVQNPIIVPEYVNLILPYGLALAGGLDSAPVAFYGGDPRAQAEVLSNSCFPMLMVPHGACVGDITLFCGGPTQCSGVAIGKSWVPTSAIIASSGSGYQVDDILILPQPSRAPYSAARVKVTGVNGSGGIASVEYVSDSGVYSVPPAAQSYYWNADNGYNGAVGTVADGNRGNVFDNAGDYLTVWDKPQGSTRTPPSGATVKLTYRPDFAANGSDFFLGKPNLQGDMSLGTIRVKGAAKTNNATFGKSFGVSAAGLQVYVQHLVTSGGYYGIDIQCTDFHADQLQPIHAGVNLSVRNCSSVQCPQAILDTWDVCALQLDNGAGVRLSGRIFHNTEASFGTIAPIQLGSRVNSTGASNVDCHLDFSVVGGGTASPTPACKISYTRASTIKVDVVNTARDGVVFAVPLTSIFSGGGGVDGTNILKGSKGRGVVSIFENNKAIPCALDVPNGLGRTVARQIRSRGNLANLTTAASAVSTWNGTFSIAPEAQNVGPFGKRNATLWTLANNDFVRQVTASAANQPVYFRVMMKTVSGAPSFVLRIYNSSPAASASVTFDATNGAILSVPTAVGTGILYDYGSQYAGNGWYSYWITVAVGSANANVSIVHNPGASGSLLIAETDYAIDPPCYPPDIVPSAYTTTVSASPVMIAYCEIDGQIFTVRGVNNGATGIRFLDMIMVSADRVPKVIASDGTTTPGAPGTRTYTLDTTSDKGAVLLQMASGTGVYSVTTTEIDAPYGFIN